MLKAFIRDSVIYAIPSIVSRGLSVILIPLYTRVLTPLDYGSFDLLTVFATLVNLTVALEVSQGVARFYASEEDVNRRISYASSALWFSILCYAIFLSIALFFSGSLSIFVMGREGMEVTFRIGAIYIFINGIFSLIQNQFRWELRSGHFAIVSLIVTLTTTFCAVTLAFFHSWGLAGLLSGMAIGPLIGCLYGLWYLRHSFRFQFQWSLLKEMLMFSAPLVPSGIAVFISQYIDRIMINHYLSLNDVGVFGMGFRLASIVGLVMVGFQGALTPLIYTHYRNPDTPRQLATIFRIFLAFALSVFLIVSLFAEEFITIMTVPSYFDAAGLVTFLVPAILFSNMYIFAPGTAIKKKTLVIVLINVGGAVVNVIFNMMLISPFGIKGAALAKLATFSLVFCSYMWSSQKLYYVPHNWLAIATASSFIGAIAYWINELRLPFEIMFYLKITGMIAGILIIIMSGLIKMTEFREVKNATWKLFTLKCK